MSEAIVLLLLPVSLALIPLLMAPGVLLYFDVTPKVAALLIAAGLALFHTKANALGLAALRNCRAGRWLTYLLAVLLLAVVGRPPAFLNNAVTKFLGHISYSFYLCHEYTSTVLWPRLFPHAGTGFSASLLAGQLALAVAFASALYFAVERPFLRLKDIVT